MDITKKNYYKILNVEKNCNSKDIVDAYNFNISKFNNLPFLTNNQKIEIKDLKTAKHILSNDDLKLKYNKLLGTKIISSTAICDRIFNF